MSVELTCPPGQALVIELQRRIQSCTAEELALIAAMLSAPRLGVTIARHRLERASVAYSEAIESCHAGTIAGAMQELGSAAQAYSVALFEAINRRAA